MGALARILGGLSGRSSLENPNTPLSDPDAWVYDVLGGGRSDGGVTVNRDAALGYPAVWRAVNLISRDVAKLPVYVYRRVGEGKERATEHPAYRLLRREPNESMTGHTFRQTLQAHLLMDGNAYAFIERDGAARPRALLPLMPDAVTPVRVGGRLWYVWRSSSGEQRRLKAEDVLHVKGLGYDGLVGYNPIAYYRESIGMGLAARKFGAVYFKNAATPKVVLQHPGKLKREAAERLRDDWQRMHAGLDAVHRTAILEEGLEAKVLSFDAESSQLLETRQFEIREIANLFGVPPHKLGDSARTSYASLEMENQSYLDDALDPWLVAWEEECWAKLLTEAEKRADSHSVEFLRQALIRADLSTRFSAYSTAVQGGWMSRDEVRARESMNPIPDGAGRAYYIPENVKTTDEIDSDDQPEGDEEDNREGERATSAGGHGGHETESTDRKEATEAQAKEADELADPQGGRGRGEDSAGPGGGAPSADPRLAEALRHAVENTAARMARRVAGKAQKAAKRPAEFLAFTDRLQEAHGATIAEALSPLVEVARAAGSRADAVDLAATMVEVARAQLVEVATRANVGDLVGAVDSWAGDFETTWAAAVAARVVEEV